MAGRDKSCVPLGWGTGGKRSKREFSFARNRRGSVALIFALTSPALFGIVGGSVDYARLVARRSQLQNAVDAGALAGGNALKLASSTAASVKGVTEQMIATNAHSSSNNPLAITVVVADDKTSVFARAEDRVSLTFGRLIGLATQTVAAQAKVTIVGKMRLCMLTLDPSAPGAFNLQKNAQVTANGCSIYSDSTSQSGMVGGDNSIAKAETICSSGGYIGLRANFSPTPQNGCPTIKDPLQDRPLPAAGNCITIPMSANKKGDTSKNLVDQDATLDPGTYCGGLHITKNAVVTLRSGTYVMKDGPLVVDKKATMNGTDVGFLFTGNKGGLVFDQHTTISLAAPTTGLMAGILMTEERAVSAPVDPTSDVLLEFGTTITPTPPPLGATQPMRIYRIISDNARTMLGTIYLPSGRVVIDAKKPVADQSAYTVIVARQVNLYEGPNLYLNANYQGTSVPVPKGVGPLGGTVVVSQ